MIALVLMLSVTACSNSNKEQQATNGSITAGTYTATTKGHNGDLSVEVTVDESSIKEVKVLENQETPGIGTGAFYSPLEALPKAIVEKQTTNVDVVTAATITSNALLTAVRDCLTQAGASETDFADKAESSYPTESEYTVDVVVVGGGAAGLTAANTVLDEGKTVLLVEKMGITGGSTVTSGGNIFAAGTKAQEKEGVEDTPEALYEFLMSYDEDNLLNEEMVRSYAFGIADDLDYLDENGVDVTYLSTAAESLTRYRLHLTSDVNAITNGIGGGITVPLTDKIVEKGEKVLFETKAESLMTNDVGKVIGVKAINNLGEEVIINAKSVILTTGGYAMNKDLTARFSSFNPIFSAAVSCTGDGLALGQSAGAQVFDSEGLQLQYVDFKTGETGSTAFGLAVDVTGKRLTNEYAYQSASAEGFKRANSYANYYITATKDGACAEPYATVQYGITLEDVAKASSLEELAEQIQVDPTTLVETVQRYNELCAKGSDDDFGKPSEYMIPVEGDTYYAFARYPVSSATFGGLVIDPSGHVLNENNEVIKGLFAAGEVALTGQLAKEYPSCGLAIGNSVHMGRIVAKAACRE